MVARSSLKFTWLLPRFSELNFDPIIFITTDFLARSFKKATVIFQVCMPRTTFWSRNKVADNFLIYWTTNEFKIRLIFIAKNADCI